MWESIPIISINKVDHLVVKVGYNLRDTGAVAVEVKFENLWRDSVVRFFQHDVDAVQRSKFVLEESHDDSYEVYLEFCSCFIFPAGNSHDAAAVRHSLIALAVGF